MPSRPSLDATRIVTLMFGNAVSGRTHGFLGINGGHHEISHHMNDPALIVAKAQGRTEVVVVLDDHVPPEAYWPCFQAVAARLSAG